MSAIEALNFVLNILSKGDKDNVPVVFVLEEFDLFTRFGKQSLLYNLFDTGHASNNPTIVVGVTCKTDCMDMLEKRVKSRFSHRLIHFYTPDTLADFHELARNALYSPFKGHTSLEFNKSVVKLFKDVSFLKIINHIYDLTRDIRLFYRLAVRTKVTFKA
jgi:origin recognition complex subunit 4